MFIMFIAMAADVLMVPPVLSLPPPVAPVRTTAGKALFENLYIPPLPPGVKPLNSFASIQSSMHDVAAATDSKTGNARFVEQLCQDKQLKNADVVCVFNRKLWQIAY